jgi:cytochrome bd ubiquinol oxidase subunit I
LSFIRVFRNHAQKQVSKQKFDGLARDILRVALLSMSDYRLVRLSDMLITLVILYPGFMSYMGETFKSLMPVYATVFVSEAFLLALYYYTWDFLKTPATKWLHMTLGVLSNGTGVILLLLAQLMGFFYDGSGWRRFPRSFFRECMASSALSFMEST